MPAHNRRRPLLVLLLIGLVLPAAALLVLHSPATLAPALSPLLALSLMAIAMISTATTGRWQLGVALALLTGVLLLLLGQSLGLSPIAQPLGTGLAMLIASLSFAARGKLFSRAMPKNGWLMALFVVSGEAAILLSAALLPPWLLALLPAQWATTAVQMALTGSSARAAPPALLALAGTGAATLLVVRLWPRRWPYLIMFTTWLALSALVWHWPAEPKRATSAAAIRPLASPQP